MDFTEHTRQVLQRLLSEGFQSPFLLVQVSWNGALIYMRVTVVEDEQQGMGFEAETLATYSPRDEGEETDFALPITQLWLDARGATQEVTIKDRGAAFRFSLN